TPTDIGPLLSPAPMGGGPSGSGPSGWGPAGPGTAPPRPSNDNPTAPESRTPGGGAAFRPGVAEPAAAWAPAASGAEPASGSDAPGVGSSGGADAGSGGAAPGRPAAVIGQEAEASRKAFHQAAAGSPGGPPKPAGRAAVLQAFFIANAGRGLLPAGETSGVLSPNLRSEES
ncbi:MAG: P-type conjugative transfer protein TrbL, partial [Brevundimonas sp.]|nr:P-type conjugative transfer protein TrbL [Brevundimonas sp.]